MTEKISYIDQQEKEIIESYQRGEYIKTPETDALKATVQEAARQYLKKDARVNIRLSGSDLTMLRRKAAIEGIPYQTLIASILHKYVSGHTNP